jgi:myo-inositol-1(or 4)-monophosphatase
VTRADIEAERLLVERLRAAYPGHAIEAEEEVRDADDGRPRWFLDPLDGTVNFVHRLPAFCVSMGLLVDGVPEVAVVFAPRLDEMFVAARGLGAHLNGEPLAVSTTDALGDAILATGFPYRRHELEHSNLENFARVFHDVRGLRRFGSAALDLAYVAAGRLDGYWELHLSPHDVAAGALLVREAGGVVCDADGGDDWLRGGHIVAAGRGLVEVLRARIAH